MTYHFSSLEDLRAQAFQRHAERMSVSYAAHFDGVQTHKRFVDPATARGVDALIEGLVMHETLSNSRLPRKQIRSFVARAVGEPR